MLNLVSPFIRVSCFSPSRNLFREVRTNRDLPYPNSAEERSSRSLNGRGSLLIGASLVGVAALQIINDKKNEEDELLLNSLKIELKVVNQKNEIQKLIDDIQKGEAIKELLENPRSSYRCSIPLAILRREISSQEATLFVADLIEAITLKSEELVKVEEIDSAKKELNCALKESLADWLFLLKKLNDKSYENLLQILIKKDVLHKVMNAKEFYYNSTYFRSHIDLKYDLTNFPEGVAYLNKK